MSRQQNFLCLHKKNNMKKTFRIELRWEKRPETIGKTKSNNTVEHINELTKKIKTMWSIHNISSYLQAHKWLIEIHSGKVGISLWWYPNCQCM